ncbi:glycosyltransferase 25 family member [Dermatophagoides pteronyssinus]|uniref:glycosyltransferase 25 family member n=1 Tax=Dermatophagoides pteronyssinus TaxID=6956 RepID=UPI003F67909C
MFVVNRICRLSLLITVLNQFELISSYHETSTTTNEYLLPTIQIVLLIHPYNKAQFLPHCLGSIESQKYTKSRIRIKLITERIFYDESNDPLYREPDDIDAILDEHIRLNEQTIRMLKRWLRENEDVYNDIELSIVNIRLTMDSLNSVTYWNKDHYSRLIDYKNFELYQSFLIWADWLIFLDADVILTNPMVFRNITSSDQVVIAPMLKSFNTYSNFWAGMDDTGYYIRSDDYLPILERKQPGKFSVPMVYSCVFINLRRTASRLLTFDPLEIQQLIDEQQTSSWKIPYDDIIAFAKSATLNGIELYVDNSEIWGWLPLPIIENKYSYELTRQTLIDLELESLIEGPSFPISSSLEQYVERRENFDTLGVDQIFVVNLARRPERRKRMEQCLNLLGIRAKFKMATDGKELSEEFLRKHGIRALDGYVDPYHKRPITFGEIGCFLSHFRIWEEAHRENYSKIIVLEDDVRFDWNFRSQWLQILDRFEKLSNEYDFLYLGRKLNDGEYDKEEIIDDLFVRPRYSYWTIGYLLTRNGIEKLLLSNPTNRMIPVDEFLPIMYGSHINETLTKMFHIKNEEKLNALSLRHLIVSPTHYVGDPLYVSDTEQSDKVDSNNDEKSSLQIDVDFDERKLNNHDKHGRWNIQPPPSDDAVKNIQHLDL